MADTSALMALLEGEPEAERIAASMAAAGEVLVGAPTRFEFLMVAAGRRSASGGEKEARELLERFAVRTVEWTARHSDLAFEAFARFGKGRHPARLNFGDCMAYALAKSLDVPLLFKGDDFAQTDVTVAGAGA